MKAKKGKKSDKPAFHETLRSIGLRPTQGIPVSAPYKGPRPRKVQRIVIKEMRKGVITIKESLITIEAEFIDFGTEKEQKKIFEMGGGPE